MRADIVSFVADVLRLPRSAPRSFVRSLAYLLAVALPFGPAIGREVVRFVPYDGLDGHATLSLEIATNWALCGRTSMVSDRHRIVPFMYADQRRVSRPLRSVVTEEAGSLDAYCAAVTEKILNGENSLMLIERWTLGVFPGASVQRIGQVVFALEIAMCLVFVFGLLALGASLLSCAVLFACALSILLSLDSHHYSRYPLSLPVLLLQIGICAAALRWGATRRPAAFAGVLFVAGLSSAFMVNLRTDTSLFALALWLAFVVYALRDRVRAGAIRWRAASALGAAAFCVGWLLFWALFIRVLPTPIEGFKPTDHPIAHPLVLALAYPRTAFATSQGIEWDDAVGDVLARRVDPQATYLGPRYEAALFRFYVQLWRDHPREMAGVYLFKSQVAGRSIVRNLTAVKAGSYGWQLLFLPLQHVTNGLAILALFAAVAVWSGRVAWRDRVPLAAMVCVVALVGMIAQLEASLLVSEFVLQYHAIELFALAVVSVAAYQVLIELAARTVATHASDEDARTATIVGCLSGTLYGALAVAAGYVSEGRLFVSEIVVGSTLAYGALAAAAYLVFRTVSPPRFALVLTTAALAICVGRPAVGELILAVADAVFFLAIACAIAGPSDSRMRMIAYAAMSGAVAMVAGAHVMIVVVMIAAGWLLAMAGRSAASAALRSLAVAALAMSSVAWVGGATAAGHAGLPFGSHGATLATSRDRTFLEQVRTTIASTPELLSKAAVPPAFASALRARAIVARMLLWLTLTITPIGIVLVARRRMRLALWLFMCWAWIILVAPDEGQPSALIGVVLAGIATSAAPCRVLLPRVVSVTAPVPFNA